jgi:hypothetical protein
MECSLKAKEVVEKVKGYKKMRGVVRARLRAPGPGSGFALVVPIWCLLGSSSSPCLEFADEWDEPLSHFVAVCDFTMTKRVFACSRSMGSDHLGVTSPSLRIIVITLKTTSSLHVQHSSGLFVLSLFYTHSALARSVMSNTTSSTDLLDRRDQIPLRPDQTRLDAETEMKDEGLDEAGQSIGKEDEKVWTKTNVGIGGNATGESRRKGVVFAHSHNDEMQKEPFVSLPLQQYQPVRSGWIPVGDTQSEPTRFGSRRT